jgi:hypothetical protein
MLPVPVTPARLPRLRPMPVFYANPTLSMLSVMLFPDDLTLAREFVARLLSHGTLQGALAAGERLDRMTAVNRSPVSPQQFLYCSFIGSPTTTNGAQNFG